MVRLARVVAVAALALVGSVFVTSPAQAAVLDISCGAPSSSVITFQPPLTLVNQLTTVKRTQKYANCQAPTAPNVISGTSIKTIVMLDDCTMILQPGPAVHIITWNTTQTSTLTLNRTASIVGTNLVVNFNGTVTAGLFTGSTAVQQFVGPAADLIACLNGVGAVRVLNSRVALKIYH